MKVKANVITRQALAENRKRLSCNFESPGSTIMDGVGSEKAHTCPKYACAGHATAQHGSASIFASFLQRNGRS